jgi:hypothetical protein
VECHRVNVEKATGFILTRLSLPIDWDYKRVGQGDRLYKTLLIEINMQRLSVGFQNEIARRVWVVGPVSVGHS